LLEDIDDGELDVDIRKEMENMDDLDDEDPAWAKKKDLDERDAKYRGMTDSEWSHKAEG